MLKIFSRIFKALAVVLFITAPLCASAQSGFETITSGQTARSNVKYQFKAPFTGTLEIASDYYAQLWPGIFCSDVNFNNPVPYAAPPVYRSIGGTYGYTYYYSVTEGNSYYFFFDVEVLDSRDRVPTFKFTMLQGGVPTEIAFIDPTPSSTRAYSITMSPMLELSFTAGGRFTGDATLTYTDNSDSSVTKTIYSEPVSKGDVVFYDFNIRQFILDNKADMKDGSTFTVLIKDPKIDGKALTGPYINADGNIELTYKYEQATILLSYDIPNPILSYYSNDNPQGVMTFTFDAPLAPKADQPKDFKMTIFAGPQPDGGEDQEWKTLPSAPLSIDGNVLTADLRGVQRITKETMVTINITGLIDAEGNYVDYNGGQIIWIRDLPYELISATELTYEFTPDGGSLSEVDNITLYVTNETLTHVEIEGFQYTVDGETDPIVIDMDGVTSAPDRLEPNDTVYTIPVPAEVQAAEGNIMLSAILKSLDGNTYSMTANYLNFAGGGGDEPGDEPGDDPGDEGAVEGIEADAAPAVYYNLHGQRVLNPDRGVYVKVANGKSVKVVL